ncbi:tubulin binding cofactor C-domain-containing protein [Lasiosphaeris hirsuta]|uniref:Tubulin binding cofactor C-domain-containing protein n=1 Tax=Lasiosphaeris hirsuta TaxID=260670 RepID=A0AA40B0K5_9PEZI|nr:tubulin binding cofactor C-domain-containing protein [Lasiosphaeris hirsuta]
MDPKERFYRQFQASCSTLQELINQIHTVSPVAGERQDAIEHILAGISRLSQEVADAGDYIPAYDQRTYSQTVKALNDQLKEVMAKSAPKSRFQFKPRAAKTAADPKKEDSRHFMPPVDPNIPVASEGSSPETHDAVGTLPTLPGKNYNEEIARAGPGLGVRKPSFSAARDITLSNHRRLHIILPASASRATSSGALTNLEGCIIDMSAPTAKTAAGEGAPFANLTLQNITGSLIIAGHVDGSVHLTGVRNSVLVLVARQIRIHECENVDLYLHSLSHPIIEDCTGMRFAPAPECYLTEREEKGTNQWDQVDDFKWLKADHSPNWSVLPEDERLPVEIWKKAVPGGPGVGVNDILKKLGVGSRKT